MSSLKTIGGSRVLRQAECSVCGGLDCYQGVDAEFMRACRNRVSPNGYEVTEAGARFHIHWVGKDTGREVRRTSRSDRDHAMPTHISEILRTRLIPLPYCDVCAGASCAKNVIGDILVCRNRRGPKAQTVTTGQGVDLHLYRLGGDFDSYPMPIGLPRPKGKA